MSEHSGMVECWPHIDEDGCCDCGCSSCSNDDGTVCICPDCNVEACGMHETADTPAEATE